jgi:hypothetical protein
MARIASSNIAENLTFPIDLGNAEAEVVTLKNSCTAVLRSRAVWVIAARRIKLSK